jgi:hypothetical protein
MPPSRATRPSSSPWSSTRRAGLPERQAGDRGQLAARLARPPGHPETEIQLRADQPCPTAAWSK